MSASFHSRWVQYLEARFSLRERRRPRRRAERKFRWFVRAWATRTSPLLMPQVLPEDFYSLYSRGLIRVAVGVTVLRVSVVT